VDARRKKRRGLEKVYGALDGKDMRDQQKREKYGKAGGMEEAFD